MILDQATSSLDSESEGMIEEAMPRLVEGRTAIVIARRLSTVRELDRVLVFDRGWVEKEDRHAELLGQDGIYRRLFKMHASGMMELM